MSHSHSCLCGRTLAQQGGRDAFGFGKFNSADLHKMPDYNAALTIADALVNDAIWSHDQCTFIGAVAPDELGLPEKYCSFQGDVYEGASGVARLLILANKLCPKEIYRKTICGALRFAVNNHEGFSLYSGSMGVGLVALETGYTEFQKTGLDLVNASLDDAIRSLDIAPADLLSGVAGVIYGVSQLCKVQPDDSLLNKATILADYLVDSGRLECVAGVPHHSWALYPGSDEYLCGLAHGASGVALALEALAKHTQKGTQKRTRWLDTAKAARNFERRWYSAEHGSWADLRRDALDDNNPASASYPHMWCHGSVGVAAERLEADSSDLLARADKIAAMEGVLSHVQSLTLRPRGAAGGDDINGSQCHGIASFTDLLIDAWSHTQHPDLLELVREATHIVKDDARAGEGLRSGVINGPSTPGLMMGDAGIAWAMFRSSFPETVPSCWKIGGLLGATQLEASEASDHAIVR